MKKKKLSQKEQCRYRLHSQAYKLGIRLNIKNKTIYHKYDEPVPYNKCFHRLINEFGYVVQYEL